MRPKAPALVLESVSKTFGSVRALSDFTLRVEEGEFVSLLGPSGCGKTTALRVTAGFEQPDSGAVYLDGRNVTAIPPERRNVALVFQSYALFPHMTVAANIAFPMKLARRPREEIVATVKQLLSMVKLEGLEDRYPHQLSGGQKQRVALARALAKKPKVLLLDEPLSALDAKIREELRAEIRRLQKSLGITSVYVTHDQEEALSISDRVVVMNYGRIEQEGPPRHIYSRPRTLFVANFVGTSTIFRGRLNRLVAGAEAEVDWRGHALRAKVDEGWPLEGGGIRVGDPVAVVVRPEHIQVLNRADQLPKNFNQMSGSVEVVTFQGASAMVHIRVDGETVMKALVSGDQLGHFEIGSQVWAGFHPANAVLLRNQG